MPQPTAQTTSDKTSTDKTSTDKTSTDTNPAEVTSSDAVAAVPQSSSLNYQALFTHNTDAVFSFDLAGCFLRVNAACEILLGYSVATLLTMTLTPLIVAEDRDRVLRHFALAARGQIQTFETTITHQAGRLVSLTVTIIPTTEGDAILGVYGIAKDITERKQAEAKLRDGEERLRLALKSGELGTFDLDLETGQYLDISDIWRTQYGVPLDKAEFTSDEWLQTVHAEDRDRVSEAVKTAIAEHQDYAAEYRIVPGDIVPGDIVPGDIVPGDIVSGDAVPEGAVPEGAVPEGAVPEGAVPEGAVVRWISAHGTLLYSERRKPLRLIGVTQDVTALKAQEAEQERAVQEAEERAEHDALTGLLNHHAFYKHLEEEASGARQGGAGFAVVVLDLDNFGFFNNVYGHAVGDVVLRQVAARLQSLCTASDTAARFGSDEFSLILSDMGAASVLEIEARVQAALSGLVFYPAGLHLDTQELAIPITLSVGAAAFPDGVSEGFEAMKLAGERLRRSKTGGVNESEAEEVRQSIQDVVQGYSMLDALVTAVDNKDRYTRHHSADVMTYSLMIARELGIEKEALQTVAVAALLHDVGKIGVSDAILRKPGKLSEEEFAAVKQHPQTGAVMVSAVPGLEGTLDAVRHHHEQWDGGGYPLGLKGDQTPLIARLMAVADAFSAMTTDRPYRQGMETEKALSVLEAGSGAQWDPECVAAFRRSLLDAQDAPTTT